jgi:repressor LexA
MKGDGEMKMGEYIKHLRNGGNRYDQRWTQEELGNLLKPKVNRAAINKWETGQVENIKRTYIEQLSNLFGITPCELMCFDQCYDEEQLSEEVQTIEQVQKVFGKDFVRMMEFFNELNETGKQKALEDLEDLASLKKYTE